MTQPDAGGAAFNPMVRTEDNTPEPDDCAPERDQDQADDGRSTGEDDVDGVR